MLKDEFITEQQQKEKSEEIHQFRQFRELVMERREQEMQSRNILKKRQLEMYEQLQVSNTKVPLQKYFKKNIRVTSNPYFFTSKSQQPFRTPWIPIAAQSFEGQIKVLHFQCMMV